MRTRRLTHPTELGTILSIWAHPDDETYLAGGLMAAARANGQRVVCVSVTAGERGTDDPATWAPDRLGQVRRWEAAAAMAVLGVKEHQVLAYPDGGLRGDDAAAVAQIGDLLDDVRPDTVLTFGRDGMTFHSDHIAVHHWVTAAWQARPDAGRLLYAAATVESLARQRRSEQWRIYMTDERPAGVRADQLRVHLRLGARELDRKLTALRAMATQTGGAIASLGEEAFVELIREESFVDAPRPARQGAFSAARARRRSPHAVGQAAPMVPGAGT